MHAGAKRSWIDLRAGLGWCFLHGRMLSLCLLAGCAAGLAGAALCPVSHTAAILLFLPHDPSQGMGRRAMVAREAALLRSDRVMERAIHRPWAEPDLYRRLSVSADPREGTVRLVVTGRSDASCLGDIAAVLAAYRALHAPRVAMRAAADAALADSALRIGALGSRIDALRRGLGIVDPDFALERTSDQLDRLVLREVDLRRQDLDLHARLDPAPLSAPVPAPVLAPVSAPDRAAAQIEDNLLAGALYDLGASRQDTERRLASLRDGAARLRALQDQRRTAETDLETALLRQAGLQMTPADSVGRDPVLEPAGPAAIVSRRSSAAFCLAAGPALGCALMAIAALAVRRRGRVYLFPDRAARDLGMPGLAVFDAGAEPGIEPGFETRDGWRRIGGLAALLLDARAGEAPVSMVQIVSETGNDDKSGLAKALATEFALGHGRRTLILDLHGGAPLVPEPAGAPEPRREANRQNPIRATAVPLLWIGDGALRAVLLDPTALAARARDFMAGLARNFDMVLVIAPPDIAAGPARRITAMVDANLLVVRSEHTRAPVATQLRDTILAAGGNLLGFAYTWRRYHIPQAIYRWL